MRRGVRLGIAVFALAGAARADSTFLRGDANGDGVRSVSDAARILLYLFQPGVPPDCLDALDVDDDGRIRLPDAIHLLNFLFSGGALPPPPNADPGPDPTPDGLDCADGQTGQAVHDPAQRITIGSAVAPPGDTVEVPIFVTNTVTIEGFQLRIAFDRHALVFEYASFAPGPVKATPDYANAWEEAPGGVLWVGILPSITAAPAEMIQPATNAALVALGFRIEGAASEDLYPLAVVRAEGSCELSQQGRSVVPLLLDGSVAASFSPTEVSPPRFASCTRRDGGADITWTNGDAYDEIQILRNGEALALLAGDATQYRDADVDSTQHGYLIYGVKDGIASTAAHCTAPGPLGAEISIPAPAGLTCETILPDIEVILTWTNGAAYDAVRIWRNGILIDELPGDAESYSDLAGMPFRLTYWVAGVIDEVESARAGCDGGLWNDPPSGLVCGAGERNSAKLAWLNPNPYDEIRIYRNLVVIATLPGDAQEYVDIGPLPVGRYDYKVEGLRMDLDPAHTRCAVVIAEEIPDSPFIRGDANTDGAVTIADACYALEFLFAVPETPDCFDAMDASDDGLLDMADAFAILEYLFQHGPPLPKPSAGPGQDPTPDGAGCAEGLSRQPVRSDSEKLAIGIPRAAPGETVAVEIAITNTAALDGMQCEFTFDEAALVFGELEEPGRQPSSFSSFSIVGLGRARLGILWDYFMVPTQMLGPGLDQVVAQIPATVSAQAPRRVYPLAFVRGGRENEFSEEGLSVIPSLEDGAVVVAAAEIAPPRDLACEEKAGEVVLTWTNGQTYDQVIVLRNVSRIAELDGSASTLRDPDPGPISIYWVYGMRGGNPSAPALCGVGQGGIPGPADLACALDPASWDVTLEWTNPIEYDAIELLRNGAVLADLPGDAGIYTDLGIGPGDYVYVVAGIIDGIRSEAALCRVGSTVSAPMRLVCELNAHCDLDLAWTNTDSYDGIRILRNDEVLAELPGDAVSYHDAECLPVGKTTYEVVAVLDTFESRAASCVVFDEGPVKAVGELTCVASVEEVRLTWKNRDAYDAIVISRDDADIAVLPGDRESYAGDTVTWDAVFGVRPRIGADEGLLRTCRIAGNALLMAGDVVIEDPGDRQACTISLAADFATHGVSFGLAHDPAVVQAFDVTVEGTDLEAIRQGNPPAFVEWRAHSGPISGVTVGVVVDMSGVDTLPPSDEPQSLVEVIYGPAEGVAEGAWCALAFTNDLGDPPLTTVVIGPEESLPPRLRDGMAAIGSKPPLFKRGDANEDGSLDIGDAISILNFLFAQGRAPACLDWIDVNDDGQLDIADGVVLATYVMGGDLSPKPPLEVCGTDPTPDDLPPCTVPSPSCR
ncbi:MAG: hypothetical protein JXP34_26930 [Planctomycetes bacterium]|nr:hypothetical protein [Planctomycetota bacterium]